MSVAENLTRDEARERAGTISDVAYRVHLDLTGGDETFGATTAVTFDAVADGASTFLDCSADEVHEVVLNGRVLDAAAVAPTRIRLDDLVAGPNDLRVVATMTYRHVGKGLHHFRDPADGRVYLHSQSEPFEAHQLYPCFDQPDLKAPFALAVDAPAGWVVVSNAPVERRPTDGEAGTWQFATTQPLSTYVTVVCAGPYASITGEHDGIPLGIYARRSLIDHLDADELFGLTAAGLDWFAEAFGMRYPFGKYDQLWVPEFSAGAMENPGAVTFSEMFLYRSRVTDAALEQRAEVLLHEMAHMWFGDLVTMRWWDDLWLNESFATFMSVLAQVNATRFTDAWVTFLDSEKAWALYQDQLPTTHPIVADMVDIESVHQNFDGITYAKGASVLRQLVAWVGQDAFLDGCRRYFADHAYGNAELQDFLAALEAASGRDLDDWSERWLLTTGLNALAVDHDTDEDGSYRSVAIRQSEGGPGSVLRPHRVALGVYDLTVDGLLRRERVELDVDGAVTEVEALRGVRAGDVLLVNDDDLTFAKLRLDDASLATLTESLHRFVDPLPRALVWSAAWDMVRDGELSAGAYIDMVVNNVASEDNVGILQRLLRRALGAVERFGDATRRTERLERLAGHARQELDNADPGSDYQLAWVRHWAAAAREGDQLEDVRRVLDGTLELPGLEVDTDLRWYLLTCLTQTGAADEPDIAAELERDATDLGERHAATARASRPSETAKRAAWERLTSEPGLTHTMGRQLWRGFQQLDQAELIEPYVAPYFDVLRTIFEDRPLEWAIEFADGMFPHPAASEDLATITERYLDGDLPRPLRRTLLEQVDVLRRTLRARRVDAGD